MANLSSLDQSAKDYFSSLPKSMQEIIMQSDVEFKSKTDIETFYRNYTSSNQIKY